MRELNIVKSFNGQKIPINQAVSKTIYNELQNRVITIPFPQEIYITHFTIDTLDCRNIYSLPDRATSDTKLGEFQFKETLNSFSLFHKNKYILFLDIVKVIISRRNLTRVLSGHHRFLTPHFFPKYCYHGNQLKWSFLKKRDGEIFLHSIP